MGNDTLYVHSYLYTIATRDVQPPSLQSALLAGFSLKHLEESHALLWALQLAGPQYISFPLQKSGRDKICMLSRLSDLSNIATLL